MTKIQIIHINMISDELAEKKGKDKLYLYIELVEEAIALIEKSGASIVDIKMMANDGKRVERSYIIYREDE